VTIGSPSAGVPKAYAGLLGGEFRDTADVESAWGNMGSYLTQVLMPSKERVNLFRSWTCLLAMMPHGGDLFWGGWNKTNPTSHDQHIYNVDSSVQNLAYVVSHDMGFEWPAEINNETSLLRSQIDAAGCGPGTGRNCTMTQAIELLRQVAGEELGNMMDGLVSLGSDDSDLSGLKDPRKWANPLESALPHAPDMKVYCLYGHNEIKSERAYWVSGTKVSNICMSCLGTCMYVCMYV
jgi:phospholipid:diacylglycerol acyltransferase